MREPWQYGASMICLHHFTCPGDKCSHGSVHGSACSLMVIGFAAHRSEGIKGSKRCTPRGQMVCHGYDLWGLIALCPYPVSTRLIH